MCACVSVCVCVCECVCVCVCECVCVCVCVQCNFLELDDKQGQNTQSTFDDLPIKKGRTDNLI